MSRREKLENEQYEDVAKDGMKQLRSRSGLYKAADKMPISVSELVWLIKRRNKCRVCRCSIIEDFVFDHKDPRLKGEELTIKNIQLICRKCNTIKKDKI